MNGEWWAGDSHTESLQKQHYHTLSHHGLKCDGGQMQIYLVKQPDSQYSEKKNYKPCVIFSEEIEKKKKAL